MNPTTNLLSCSNEQPSTNIISRKFFNTYTNSTNNLPRRMIATRRASSMESNSTHMNSSIYNFSESTVNNHSSIYDENTLKKQATKANGYKRKLQNEQQDKKRQKLTIKTTKHHASMLKSSYPMDKLEIEQFCFIHLGILKNYSFHISEILNR